MGRPGVFTGPLVIDVVAWGIGGQLFGLVGGYVYGEAHNYLAHPSQRRDALTLANRAAARGAVFAVAVALVGHLFVAILY